MNKRAALALVTLLSLLLPGCAPAGTGGTDGEEARLTVLASTYPVYLAARSVAEGWRASPSSGWRRGRCPASTTTPSPWGT